MHGRSVVTFNATASEVVSAIVSGALYYGGAFLLYVAALRHVVNTGDSDLKLYSLYAPPEHPDGTAHRTKADAADLE